MRIFKKFSVAIFVLTFVLGINFFIAFLLLTIFIYIRNFIQGYNYSATIFLTNIGKILCLVSPRNFLQFLFEIFFHGLASMRNFHAKNILIKIYKKIFVTSGQNYVS